MHENAPRQDADAAEPTPENDPFELVGTVVRYEDGPDECTLYPRDATEAELLTTWITAVEGDFVELTGMR